MNIYPYTHPCVSTHVYSYTYKHNNHARDVDTEQNTKTGQFSHTNKILCHIKHCCKRLADGNIYTYIQKHNLGGQPCDCFAGNAKQLPAFSISPPLSCLYVHKGGLKLHSFIHSFIHLFIHSSSPLSISTYSLFNSEMQHLKDFYCLYLTLNVGSMLVHCL